MVAYNWKSHLGSGDRRQGQLNFMRLSLKNIKEG